MLILSVFSFLIGESQNNTGIVMKINGYMINLDGQMLFQPCEDTALSIWESFDNSSFGIWCNQITNRYCESMEGIGDSVSVKYMQPSNTRIYQGTMIYFYCTIKIYLKFIGNNANDFCVYKDPQYQLLFGQKKYPLDIFYVRENLMEVVPLNRKFLTKMYDFYKHNDYVIPLWLTESVR
ncbi:hypothetical protein [Chitinophaga sp.]|uniref:hypothetical protein n=1 Tax=Chitinophaga sp. TaxID=1869181 RepID=UPI002F93B85D